MKRINEITFADLYNNQDLCMDILLGLYDQDIKKANKKAGKVVAFKKPKKLPKPVDKKPVVPVVKEEPVVVSIEEQKPMAPAIEEPVVDMSTTSLIDDKDQAIEVIMNQLDNKATDLSEEDFVPEVWAEAWDIANERYYSMADEDYQETVMDSGERIIRMSPNRLSEFMEDRSQTIASWGIEDTVNDEYIYEDDEVNVPEECDVTILSFRQAFDCMKAEEPAQKSKLDTLLDIIIDNQEEFKDKYERHLAEDDYYYKGCPDFLSINGIGLTADDLSEKALARTLYRETRRWCVNVKDRYSRRIYESKYKGNELFTRDDLLDTLAYISTYDIYVPVLNFFDITNDIIEYREAV